MSNAIWRSQQRFSNVVKYELGRSYDAISMGVDQNHCREDVLLELLDLQGELRGELVSNGTFTSDLSDWTDPNAHYAWDAGRAYHAPDADFNGLYQDVHIKAGTPINFAIDVVQGSVQVIFHFQGSGNIKRVFSASGTHESSFSNTVTRIEFAREAGAGTTEFYVDNVSALYGVHDSHGFDFIGKVFMASNTLPIDDMNGTWQPVDDTYDSTTHYLGIMVDDRWGDEVIYDKATGKIRMNYRTMRSDDNDNPCVALMVRGDAIVMREGLDFGLHNDDTVLIDKVIAGLLEEDIVVTQGNGIKYSTDVMHPWKDGDNEVVPSQRDAS